MGRPRKNFTEGEIPEEILGFQDEPEANIDYKWQPIGTVPRNGIPLQLSETDDQEKGVIAYWRKTRAFANATHRWEETGFWTNTITGQNITFIPLFWKDQYS